MNNNPTAFIQWLRETEPDAYGRGGVGSEAEDPIKLDQKAIHDLFEMGERLSVAATHLALFRLLTPES